MTELEIKWPPSGRYVLAVSGGADSMVLLGLMAGAAAEHKYELIVAHFDHGIRSASSTDRKFVEKAAKSYMLPFEFSEGELGKVSEANARSARHKWLEELRQSHQALAVITAHHQDDVIETSLLNLARGSGRRGLAPMGDGGILRPLLQVSRKSLRAYATVSNIGWVEDPTNTDITNPRNFLRHKLLPQADASWRSRYLELIENLNKLNKKVDQSISAKLSTAQAGPSQYSFSTQMVQDMSLSELEELLLAAAIRLSPDIELDRRLVQEVALFAKTSSPEKWRPLRGNVLVEVQTGAVRVYYMGISKEGRR